MADNDGTPPDPRYQQPPQVKPVAPAPRVNPPNINTPKEAPPAGGPPGFGDFLEWMRTQVGGDSAAPAESQRTLIPKEKKKFQRREAESKDDRTAPTDEELDAPAKPSLPPAPTRPVTAAAVSRELPATNPEALRASRSVGGDPAESPTSSRVRRGQHASAKGNSWFGLFVQIGVLALLIGSFLLGRATASRTATTHTAAPAALQVVNKDGKTTINLLSDANAALIDQAMVAEQASDFKKAAELLEQVKASGEHVHGLGFQIAQLAVFANENLRAVQLLNDAINEGEELSSVYNLRATLGARGSMIRNGPMNDFENAAKVNPFDEKVFFFWGSALRWGGKPQAALVRLQQAYNRLHEPTAEGLYRLTIRLTQIELGQEKEFSDELNKQMALPNPGMDWLFTAAALSIRDGNLAEAAAYLTRADQVGDPDAFSLRIRDFYFYQHRFDKELKHFFDRLTPAKPGSMPTPPPSETPSAAPSAPPAVGLDVPALPPPASPGATVPR